jgi:hypothetical protein
VRSLEPSRSCAIVGGSSCCTRSCLESNFKIHYWDLSSSSMGFGQVLPATYAVAPASFSFETTAETDQIQISFSFSPSCAGFNSMVPSSEMNRLQTQLVVDLRGESSHTHD